MLGLFNTMPLSLTHYLLLVKVAPPMKHWPVLLFQRAKYHCPQSFEQFNLSLNRCSTSQLPPTFQGVFIIMYTCCIFMCAFSNTAFLLHNSAEVLGGDSLTIMLLISKLNSVFRIKLSPAIMFELKTVNVRFFSGIFYTQIDNCIRIS